MNLEKEIFLDIPDYEGFYQVSNLGNVKSLERKRKGKNNSVCINKERILKPGINKDGYYKTNLYKNGERKTYTVHRLVLLTFHGKSELQCNHKNGIKTDNRLSKLEYCTPYENTKHACDIGLRNNNKSINQYTKDGKFVNGYDSLKDASGITNINQCNISNCAAGRLKSAGGFVWKFK